MTEIGRYDNDVIDAESATAVAGAIGMYLGHNKFKILSIKECVKNSPFPENGKKIVNSGLFSFISSWQTRQE